MDNSNLFDLAQKAKNNAYSPISNYQVGAALLCKNNNIYVGCNVEDSSLRSGSCAERVAFFTAIANGENNFEKIVIVGGFKNQKLDKITPCGTCRQLISEFCSPNFEIINYYEENNEIKSISYTLNDLLPFSFELS